MCYGVVSELWGFLGFCENLFKEMLDWGTLGFRAGVWEVLEACESCCKACVEFGTVKFGIRV